MIPIKKPNHPNLTAPIPKFSILSTASPPAAIEYKNFYCDGKAKRSALDKYDIEKCLVIEEKGIFERLGLWEKINEYYRFYGQRWLHLVCRCRRR